MREIGVFEAKNKLSALLDQVERGEEIIITRHGKPVARLAPLASGFDRAKASAPLRDCSKRAGALRWGGPVDQGINWRAAVVGVPPQLTVSHA